MIQRIQSVYFLIALLLCAFPLFGLELFAFHWDEQQISMNAYALKDLENTDFSSNNDSWILCLILIVLLLITLISYKNRKRQITLAWFAFILNLLTTSWMVLGVYVEKSACTSCSSTGIDDMGIGFFTFASAFLFIFLGLRGVQKDKKLIDSLDRLR
jgi:hypothetical protein